MQIVVDCSVFASMMFADEQHPYALKVANVFSRLKPVAPSIFKSEVINVLLLKERRKRITPEDAEALFEYFERFRVEVLDISNKWIFSFARKYQLTSYDASYLALAKQQECPLATLDEGLKKAAISENLFYNPA